MDNHCSGGWSSLVGGWVAGQDDGKDCCKINELSGWYAFDEKCKAAECTEHNGDGSDLSAAKSLPL